MAKKETQYKQVTTPIGKSFYTELYAPVTRFVKKDDADFKQGGFFKAVIRLSGEESAGLKKLLTDMHNENLKEACQSILDQHIEKYPKQKDKIKDAVKFVQEETEIKVNPIQLKQVRNEDGDLTDEWQLEAKQWAKYVEKDKKGKVIKEGDIKPEVRDPHNNKYDVVPKIGNGSLLRLRIELKGYQAPTIGVRVRLIATQVWELIEYNGGGFDDSDFEANPEAPALVTAGEVSEEDDEDDIDF